jgi:hypothetical protein
MDPLLVCSNTKIRGNQKKDWKIKFSKPHRLALLLLVKLGQIFVQTFF